jgi:hypothetical protein
MCMPDKSRDAWPDASPTTMPPFCGLMRKAVFYQRTTGSSSTKEPQDSPRESQCVKRIFPLERKCN